MTASALSPTPSTSSQPPMKAGLPPQLFSPFQSQHQQQMVQLPHPGMMELSRLSGPPLMHQHPDHMGEPIMSLCTHRGVSMVWLPLLLLPCCPYACFVSQINTETAPEAGHAVPAGAEVPVAKGPARLVSIGNRLQLDLDPASQSRHFHARCHGCLLAFPRN